MTDNEIEMQTAADLQELAQAVFSEAGLNPVLNQHEAGRELARAVLKTGHRGVCNCAYCRCERLLARADAAESRAAELERQLAHEQTLRKSAEERVVELERLIASVGDLAPKLRWESHADCAAWLDAAANHRARVAEATAKAQADWDNQEPELAEQSTPLRIGNGHDGTHLIDVPEDVCPYCREDGANCTCPPDGKMWGPAPESALKAALRASVEAAERKRGGGR